MSTLVSYASWLAQAPRDLVRAIAHRRRDLVRTDTATPARFAGLASTRAAVAVGLESLNADQLRLAWHAAKRARAHPLITDLGTGSAGTSPASTRPSLDVLVESALVWPSGDGHRIQAEVIALLPTTAFATRTSPEWAGNQPPATLRTRPAPSNVAANAAAAAVNHVLSDLATVVDAFAQLTPSQLVKGGISRRDATTLANRCGLDLPTTVFFAQLAKDLRLVAVGGTDDDPQWMPTVAFDAFHDDRADAFTRALSAWLVTVPNTAHVARGSSDTGDKLHVLGTYTPRPAARPVMPFARYRLLTLLEDLTRPCDSATDNSDTDNSATDNSGTVNSATTTTVHLADLAELLRFEHPLASGFDTDTVRHITTEAERLGLVFTPFDAPDCVGLTHLGHALSEHLRSVMTAELSPLNFDAGRLAPPETFRDLLTPLLPELTRTVITQSDLTAVATGPLHPETASALSRVAQVETRGQGTVYRFTPASLTRAFEHGMSAANVRDLIARASSTTIPGPLDFLITDTATKLGRVTVLPARGVIVVNDPEELDPLLTDPALTSAHLQRVAPTVAVAAVGPARLSVLLAAHGIETLGTTPPGPARAPLPAKPAPVRRTSKRAEDVATFVDHLTNSAGGAGGAGGVAGTGGTGVADSPTTIAGTIRNAVDTQTPLVIDYATRAGARRSVRVVPTSVSGGLVRGSADSASSPSASSPSASSQTASSQTAEVALPLASIVAVAEAQA